MTLKLVQQAGRVRPRRRGPVPSVAACLPLLTVVSLVSLLALICLQEPLRQPRPPPPAGYYRLYPGNATLPGMKGFSYVINSDICGHDDVRGVIVVTSHEGDQQVRDAWRRLVNRSDLEALGLRRVFLLGQPSRQRGYTSVDESLVEAEAAQHADIVQGNFRESYRNLTLKHLMGLQWAADFCSQASYVIKMDDDIAVDIYQLSEKLRDRYPPRHLLLGLIHYDMRPVRDRTSKWYVPEREYPAEFYHPFLSGWMYVVSMDVVPRLVAAAYQRPLFWIDDVHVTGTLAGDAGVRLSSLNAYYTPHVDHLECCARDAARRCDYMVGPAGGEVALMEDFLGQARRCWLDGCERRPMELSLARTCVGTGKYRHSSPVKGVAEVVPLG